MRALIPMPSDESNAEEAIRGQFRHSRRWLRRVQREFTADRSAPPQARAMIDEVDTGFPRELLDRAMLAMSELVTNAVLHGSRIGDEISVLVLANHDRLRMRVSDQGSPVSHAEPGGGFGLGIVEQVADDWKIDDGETWSVWATFKPR